MRKNDMRNATGLLALALIASLAVITPASAEEKGARDGARGGFAVQEGRGHSSQFGTPSGLPTLVETTPLEFDFEEGDEFSYASAACEFRLPFNDTSLILRGYPGLQSPGPAAYILEGKVTETNASDDRGTVEGTLTIIRCAEAGDGGQNELEAGRIFVEYEAKITKKSPNNLPLRGGTFRITGGTGIFDDISGRGSFKGRLTCLPGTLDNDGVPPGTDNCAELGVFSDAAFNLRGSYSDPTVPSA
jgi:hypothetical protein